MLQGDELDGVLGLLFGVDLIDDVFVSWDVSGTSSFTECANSTASASLLVELYSHLSSSLKMTFLLTITLPHNGLCN